MGLRPFPLSINQAKFFMQHVHKFTRGLVLLALFFLPLNWDAPVLCQGRTLAPHLVSGMAWDVTVRHRSVIGTEKWGPPEVFQYSVSDTSQGGQCIEVKDGFTSLIGRIHLQDDSGPLRVETLYRLRGRTAWRTFSVEQAGPVRTRGSIFPYDWPVFPLEEGEERDFHRTIQVEDGLVARRTLTQKVRIVPVEELPVATGAVKPQGRIFKVTCVEESGDLLFVQYWVEGSAWPLYGENPDMQYWVATK